MNPISTPVAERLCRLSLALACLTLAGVATARQAGEPRSWSLPDRRMSAPVVIELEPLDPAALLAEDAQVAALGKGGAALRFAVARPTAVTLHDGGAWTALADGGMIWQTRLRVPGATDLNFVLSATVLPRGATVHFFSSSERYYQGPYTARDLNPEGRLWSPVVPGAEAVVELYLPPDSDPAQLAVPTVNGGYRDLFARKGGPVLKQGTCNIDVVCPQGDPYRDPIRSVAAYSLGGNILCTGTLMMDALASFRPWFLTAAHCGIDNEADADSIVVYWNFESPTCGALSGGSLDQNQAGAAFRAQRDDVDMSLVELDSAPDPAFNVHYSGWDRSGSAPGASVHIHHPGGDEKAISFNDDPLTSTESCIVRGNPPADTHWLIDDYEAGTTEPGSSGSGVWTPAPQSRLVGFLSGGTASCSLTTGFDCYGKFSVAWEGSSAATRLRDWLGGGLVQPPQTVDGSDPPMATFSDGFESP
ncbi:MAG TPA: hypothetical protein VFG21_11375 [Xanthomonadaceae bacterium]|nr:hypothetical protein [Xanthomonadaceae bacterium]